MFVRAYLRASTEDQDANRARDQLKTFAAERHLSIATWYVENESGAKLSRPELFRLLKDAQPDDILLVEQVDSLSRLTTGDWEKLKAELTARRVRVVALDLPTSWMMATSNTDSGQSYSRQRVLWCGKRSHENLRSDGRQVRIARHVLQGKIYRVVAGFNSAPRLGDE
jgi:DNA invertase Pin-like site-specific DNA recombinase